MITGFPFLQLTEIMLIFVFGILPAAILCGYLVTLIIEGTTKWKAMDNFVFKYILRRKGHAKTNL